MRKSIVGGVIIAAVVVAAFVAVGSAGAQGDPTPVGDLVNETQTQLENWKTLQSTSDTEIWAIGGLAGLGIGVAVGSVVTYVGWRRR